MGMLEGEVFGILVSRTGERCQQDNSAVVFVVLCSVEKLQDNKKLQLQ